MPGKAEYLVGVISDTHGSVPAVVERVFTGVDLIVHAGDVGSAGILTWLKRIAPVVAVRGNTDSLDLEHLETVDIGGVRLCVVHDIHRLPIDPRHAGFAAVISGHSHRPSLRKEGGVIYLNPGSASRPRGGHLASAALIRIGAEGIDVEFATLE